MAESTLQLVADYLVEPLVKAINPLDPDGFLVLVSRFSRALKGAAAEHEAEALKAAFKALDIDWTKATAGQKNAAVVAAQKALKEKPQKALPQLEQTFAVYGSQTVKGSKEGSAKTFGLKLGTRFDSTDKKVVARAASSAANYARDQYGAKSEVLAAKARAIVADGLEKGYDRYQIGKALREDLTLAAEKKSKAYWEMVAAAHTNRARSYGALATYAVNGVQQFQFEAVMDEITTLQCRLLHGRTFSVATSMQKLLDAESLGPDVATPWLGVEKDSAGERHVFYKDPTGVRQRVATVAQNSYGKPNDAGSFKNVLSDAELEARGVVVPPVHGNCRSTIVPLTSSIIDVPVTTPTASVPVATTPEDAMIDELSGKKSVSPEDLGLLTSPEAALNEQAGKKILAAKLLPGTLKSESPGNFVFAESLKLDVKDLTAAARDYAKTGSKFEDSEEIVVAPVGYGKLVVVRGHAAAAVAQRLKLENVSVRVLSAGDVWEMKQSLPKVDQSTAEQALKAATKDKYVQVSSLGLSSGVLPSLAEFGVDVLNLAAVESKDKYAINPATVIYGSPEFSEKSALQKLGLLYGDVKEKVVVVEYKNKFYGFQGQSNLIAAHAAGASGVECVVIDASKLVAAKPGEAKKPEKPKVEDISYEPAKPGQGRKAIVPADAAKPRAGLKVADLPVGPLPEGSRGVVPYARAQGEYGTAGLRDEKEKSVASSLNKGLTAAQIASIQEFTGADYKLIRAAEGSPEGAALRSAMDLREYKKHSENIEAARKKAKHVEHVVFRKLSALKEEVVERLISSEDATLGGTASTSWDARVALDWGGGKNDAKGSVLYVINQKTGILVDTPSYSRNAQEREVLLAKGTKLKVTGVTRTPNGGVVIYADEVD